MSKSKTIPIRFSAETAERLKEADEKLKLGNKSLLVKLCLEAFLRAFAEEGELVLPMNWREIARSLDGRRKLDLVAEKSGKAGTPLPAGKKVAYPKGKK